MSAMRTTNLRRQRELSELVRDAFALAAANWRVLAIVSFAIVAPVELIAFGIGLRWLSSGYAVDTLGSQAVQLVVSYLIVAPLVFAAVISVLLQLEGHDRPSPRTTLRAAFDAFPALLLVATASALVIVAGVFALVVPGVVLGVRLGIVLPVAMLERPRGLSALPRAFALTAGRFWNTLGRLLVIGLATGLPGFLVQSIFDAIAKSADSQAIHLVGSIVSDPLTVVPAAIATTLLYFDLADREAKRISPTTAPPPPPGL